MSKGVYNPMYLCNLFDKFKDNLQSERDVSNSTITSYQHDFNSLIKYLRKNNYSENINSISTSILREWISYLKIEKKYHSNTIRRKINSTSSFFKYMLENEYINKNPMLPIHAPKKKSHYSYLFKER